MDPTELPTGSLFSVSSHGRKTKNPFIKTSNSLGKNSSLEKKRLLFGLEYADSAEAKPFCTWDIGPGSVEKAEEKKHHVTLLTHTSFCFLMLPSPGNGNGSCQWQLQA